VKGKGLTAVLALANKLIQVRIDEQTGCFDVVQTAAGVTWRPDPWQASAGDLVLRCRETGADLRLGLSEASSVRVSRRGSAATIAFEGLKASDGSVLAGSAVCTCLSIESAEPELTITIVAVRFDEARFEMESLLYPARQFPLMTNVDDGYMALPYNQGALVPSGRFKVPLRDEWHMWDDLSWQSSGVAWGVEGASGDVPVYGWNALSMPWFGAAKGAGAFVCVIDTDDDAQVHFVLNYNDQDEFSRRSQASTYPRIVAASPRWLPVRGRLGYPRRAGYRFLPNGTHVDMAKHYRSVAERKGLVVTLPEKVQANPEVAKLFGAPLINIDGGYPWYADYQSLMLTWSDVKRVAEDLRHELGLARALICTWGGYSKLPPESYPFHPDWGTGSELRAAVRRIHELGYLYCSYHGYAANLPHAPSFSPDEGTRNRAGGLGGRWGGRCSATYMKHARADLPRILEATAQSADYTDMVTAGYLRECYHPDHPLVRSEDRRNRTGLLDYVRSLGLVCGSEVAQGYAVPHLDYTKGAMYVGLRYFLLQHIHVPLFSLVFHDCVVMYDGTVGTSRSKEYSNEVLECLAYGIQPVFSFNMPHYPGARSVIRETSALMSDFQHRTATDSLAGHEYLAGGYDVQRTTFASGARVTINTDTAPFETDGGLQVPARGFVIETEDGPMRKGAIRTTAMAQ
jgi:hypothetical protein